MKTGKDHANGAENAVNFLTFAHFWIMMKTDTQYVKYINSDRSTAENILGQKMKKYAITADTIL